MNQRGTRAALLAAALLGCGTGDITGQTGSGGADASTTGDAPEPLDATTTTTGEDPPDPATPTTGSWDDYACDPWKQDCPEGQKCTMYSKDGGLDLDASKCVPIAPDPGQFGEPCTAPQGPGHGDDDCDEGGLCTGLSPKNTGLCTPFCAGSMGEPICPEGMLCTRGNGQLLYLCKPTCDPLAQDCIEGELCVAAAHEEGYVCAIDRSDAGGQIYGDCQHTNECAEGLHCAPDELAPGCVDDPAHGCCLPFCEVGIGECPDGLECAGLHDAGDLVNVGVCASPG